MADADYFLDLSSPDPLADEVPSSVRPASRRITKSPTKSATKSSMKPQPALAPLSIPPSSPPRASREQSPRKRTFELDVGNERSPQRIRVTVEADEDFRDGAVNRQLFPASSASPTRNSRRRDTITATTTTVPLNDDDATTPRKRGRPRRISNGTPMPKTRKRAGTPMQRTSKQARLEDEPPSEGGHLNDATTKIGGSGGQDSAKRGTRTRKTPRKPPANASAPSSQASNKTTGRKRGRPRKVPVSEESTVASGDRPESSRATTSGAPASESRSQRDGYSSPAVGRRATSSEHDDDHHDTAPAPDSPRRRDRGTASPVPPSPPRDSAGISRHSSSPMSLQQGLAEDDDYTMGEDFEGIEPQSDLRSAESEDGFSHHGQDTIADASDFSMIAVESLPSFQASFQASVNSHAEQPVSDQHEMGEETSRIISETLDSLRRSLQDVTEASSGAAGAANDLSRLEEQDQPRDQSTIIASNYESERPLSKSPRRPKQIPLSRQVFVGRGNVDDSFSTIPDSILYAATPRRPSTRPTVGENEHRAETSRLYNDSFSEVPDAVLEAATPRPARRVETLNQRSPTPHEEPHQTTHLSAQRSSVDYASNRLPTPEETSSSNAGSAEAQGQEEEEEEDADMYEEIIADIDADADADADMDADAALEPHDQPSSPPIMTRPRALDFGYSNLQHELNTVQEEDPPSPQRQPTQIQSLEARLPPSRPSLSPIVRAGRSLQNVMSDNSSPEGKERNLGSPFKGSLSSDPQQSSVVRSSSPSVRVRGNPNKSQLSVGSPTRLAPTFRTSLDRNFGPAVLSSGEARNPFRQGRAAHSRTGSLQDSSMQKPPRSSSSLQSSSQTGSARAGTLNAIERTTWQNHGSDSYPRNIHQPSSQTTNSQNQAAPTPSMDVKQAPGAVAGSMNSDLKQDQSHHDEPAQNTGQDGGDQSDEEHEHNHDHDHEDEEEGEEGDLDVWDFEASRASPEKSEPPQNTSKPPESDAPPRKRSKVPSPWKRNVRRLIYKDDIASSTQIEIEESSQSENEDDPSTSAGERPAAPQPPPDSNQQAPDPEPVPESPTQEELNGKEKTASSSPSHGDEIEEFVAEPAHSDESDQMEEDDELEQADEDPVQMHEDEMHGHDDQNEVQGGQEKTDMHTAQTSAAADLSEYSLVAQQMKQNFKEQTPRAQQQPAAPKPGFFGKLDIMSFFSSPATLPRNKSSGSNQPKPTHDSRSPQQPLEAKGTTQPPKALWSNGLFPSLPRKNSQPSEPSSDRTIELSPEPALRPNDTIAGTYEPSSSPSPSPTRSAPESAAPSTPERRVFPPIQQKQNFTPQPGGSRGSLFAPSQGGSSVAGDIQHDESQDLSEEQDEEVEESSAVTEGSDYERVPPREKPSQWDRNLSPTKSCFRSPLKPTTPGRLVAFSNSVLSPQAQAQAEAEARSTLSNFTANPNTYNAMMQASDLRHTLEGKENQRHGDFNTSTIRKNGNASHNNLDHTNHTTMRNSASASEPPPQTKAPPLSQTTWTTQHWARLDEILYLRRSDPKRFQQSFPRALSLPRSRRRSTPLLGKEVTVAAQDARMILEEWHLDVVEAFSSEVEGWDEKGLAKRVFALVVGEERRRAVAAAAAARI
ncbi:hypothetical protein F4808DRAFT_460687 [Astrocystis sublimbata]|nr:hypothetical protein F4808DRAFT_460687 [Astrocystis sublimbata]